MAVFSAIRGPGSAAQVHEAVLRAASEELARMSDVERAALGYGEQEWANGAATFAGQLQWFREWLPLDPVEIYRRIDAPILALYGELDRQVPPDPNSRLIKQALRERRARAEVVVLPAINHQMQPAHTDSPAEYGQISETIARAVLDRIISWAHTATKGK